MASRRPAPGLLALIVAAVGIYSVLAYLVAVLFHVSALDPLVFGSVAGVLLTVATAASLIPALRAARVDPLEALRAE